MFGHHLLVFVVLLGSQSMAFGGFGKDELIEPAQIALSAMTMLTVLQSDGYALLR